MKDNNSNLDSFWGHVANLVLNIKTKESPYEVLVSNKEYRAWVEISVYKLEMTEDSVTYQPEYGETLVIISKDKSKYLNRYEYCDDELQEFAYLEIRNAFRFRERKSYSQFMNSKIAYKEYDSEDETTW